MVRHNKPDTHTHWRDFLKGNYPVNDPNSLSKMKHDIRKRATRLMEDLLLICQSSNLSKEDKNLIFKNLNSWENMPYNERVEANKFGRPTTIWQNVMKPLVKELMNNAAILTPESESVEEIQELFIMLEIYGKEYDIKFNVNDLINDSDYRERKMQQLLSKKGAKKKLTALRNARQDKLQITPIPRSEYKDNNA
jgi:hypothetical protein